ncbi:hypothetical protein GQ53DRAFT_843878 [Thozetella sp. PMI_491]|nr:hypothetical protein GQ53DRAFT_843878 [Thozetella sp. PMI_491]
MADQDVSTQCLDLDELHARLCSLDAYFARQNMDGLKRNCFITVGATAGFRPLLEEIISEKFLIALERHNYGSLIVQCGPDHEWFAAKVASLCEKHGINITSFERTHSMAAEYLKCRGQKGVQLAGCVVSHAGSGTILEAGRYSVPLVVVPNPTLMNNHQLELAEEVERQNWAVHGHLGKLDEAINRNQERIVEGRHDHLPPYREEEFRYLGETRIKVFDWVALTTFPEEMRLQEHLLALTATDEKHNLTQSDAHPSYLRLD